MKQNPFPRKARKALDRAGIRDSTTVIVVSDHGFKTYRKLIHPNALLRTKGLLRDAGDVRRTDAIAVEEPLEIRLVKAGAAAENGGRSWRDHLLDRLAELVE